MICAQALTYTDKISKDLNLNKLNFAILDFLGILFWYISLEAGRGLELRGRSPSRPKPRPSPDDAIGAGYAWAKFKLRLAA